MQLFRSEAIKSQSDKSYGEPLLFTLPSTKLFTLVAAGVGFCIICFLFVGQYTRKAHVAGYLVPDVGMIKVFTPQPGIVLRTYIKEGQQVSRGDNLLTISSERATANYRKTGEEIRKKLGERRDSLLSEKRKQAEIDQLSKNSIGVRLNGINIEIAQTTQQLELQKYLIKNAEKSLKRFEDLASAKFLSEVSLQQKRDEIITQRSQLLNLEKNLAGLLKEKNSAQIELISSAPKHESNQIGLQRQISEIDQQMTEAEMQQTAVLTAPMDGKVTTLMAEVGQSVNTNSPMLSIFPTGAKLEAQLLAPTSAIGFIKVGQTVALRYQAFSYQRFGHFLGKITEIGHTVIQPNEANLPISLQEPVYRIKVQLQRQDINAYGESISLQAGMALDADIWIEQRRLIEWIFDPLISIIGRA